MAIFSVEKKKDKLKEIKKIASTKNIKVLDEEYIDSKIKFNCQCLVCKHYWEITAPNLTRGRGCPKCAGHVPRPLNEIIKILLAKNIKLYCKKYTNNNTRERCKCLACGFEWKTSIKALLRGTGCPKCAGKIPKPFENIKEILLTRNINILSDKYINCSSKLDCECLICFYRWETSSNQLLSKKAGCPKCAGSVLKSYNEIIEILLARNIKLLTEHVNKNVDLLKVKCITCSFLWETTYKSLINNGSGCCNCKSGFGERATRFIFQSIFEKNFVKIKPDWIIGKRKLELDGYNAELKLAFEHNGMQHYNFVPIFHKTIDNFIKQTEYDKIKRKACNDRGIVLIEIDNRNKVGFNELFSIIESKLFENMILFNSIVLREKDFYNAIKEGLI